MRIWMASLGTILLVGLGACNRDTSRDREDPAARQIGRDAYELKQNLKQGARKAAQELRRAGKEAHEGWNQAKQEDQSRRDRNAEIPENRDSRRRSENPSRYDHR